MPYRNVRRFIPTSAASASGWTQGHSGGAAQIGTAGGQATGSRVGSPSLAPRDRTPGRRDGFLAVTMLGAARSCRCGSRGFWGRGARALTMMGSFVGMASMWGPAISHRVTETKWPALPATYVR
jgi:hypothetical protein